MKWLQYVRERTLGLDRFLSGDGSARSPMALLLRSLHEDSITMRRQFVRNSIAGSVLVPRCIRWGIYRMTGLKIDTPNIAEGCRINNSYLVVGTGTFVNQGCFFQGSAPIVIGKDCLLAPDCSFVTGRHRFLDDGSVEWRGDYLPITLGDRVFLGTRVTLLPGAVIEDDCVVAAGAVVTGHLGAGGFYGGVPAKLIRSCAEAAPK
jgi:acetyltransferase-like isoleucine patch superfamily enzyme